MERQSTGETQVGQLEKVFYYYDIIDVMAKTKESQLRFFANEDTDLTEEEFKFFLNEEGKFRIDYLEDGTVKIFVQIDTEQLAKIIKMRVTGNIS